ncbi:enoyl CoA hydratase domain-containing protein 1 [Nowakowskiella sp. JEL0407]|nr:enoyl CoA hydratase domain-containing protein 1 [Nowakowskiella sp. JEL0407]
MSISLSSISSRIAKLSISNPLKKNAISLKMMQDFSRCVDVLGKDKELCAVIVTGDHSSFCSGFDLSSNEDALSSKPFAQQFSTLMQENLLRLSTLPIISVAAVNGYALGGGAELATSCDFIVASRSAKIRFLQIKMGVVPGWGGGVRLVEKVGATSALKLLGTAAMITPDEGVRVGLVDAVADEAVQGAVDYLDPFLFEIGKDGEKSYYSTEVSRGMKEIINNARYGGMNLEQLVEVLKKEREIFLNFWGGPANLKALSGRKKT